MDTWQQVSISVTREAVEATANLFCEAGARNGVEIDDPLLLKELKEHTTWELCDLPMPEETEIVTVSAYYLEDEELSGRLSTIKEGLSEIEKRIGSFQIGQLRFRKVSEKDWANEWKQYFHTTKIGSQIVIKPDWESYTPTAEEKVIELDPGMAFGTGTHATTRMCIERLEELVTPNIDVYDVGTGSGILAMTAALMGARSIHAIDIDGKAVEVAKENIAKITFPTGLRSKRAISSMMPMKRPISLWQTLLLTSSSRSFPMHSKSSVKAGSSSPRASSRSAFAMWKKRLGNMVLLSLMLKTVLVGPQSP